MSKWPRDTVLAHSHSHLPRLNVHQAGQASPCLCLIHKTRALEPGGSLRTFGDVSGCAWSTTLILKTSCPKSEVVNLGGPDRPPPLHLSSRAPHSPRGQLLLPVPPSPPSRSPRAHTVHCPLQPPPEPAPLPWGALPWSFEDNVRSAKDSVGQPGEPGPRPLDPRPAAPARQRPPLCARLPTCDMA